MTHSEFGEGQFLPYLAGNVPIGGFLREDFLDQPEAPDDAADNPAVFEAWRDSLRPDTNPAETFYLAGFRDPVERQSFLDLIEAEAIQVVAEHDQHLGEAMARGFLSKLEKRSNNNG